MKILLIDIETAPHTALIWGPKNSYIQPKNVVQSGYTMCFAAKWLGKRGLTFKSIQRHGAEEMARAAWQLLHDADAVIHYNGTKFDIPILNADFVDHGLKPPSQYHEIDLLKTARQRFRRYSNKLDEIGKWLGVGSKIQHKGLDLWIECMDGDEKAWRVMERYNKQDVILLEKVYHKLLPWIKSHPNHALYTDTDRPVCPTCGSQQMKRQGWVTTKTQKYRQYECKECGSWMRDRSTAIPRDKARNILASV